MEQLEVKSYWSPDIHNPWGYKPWGNKVIFSLEIEIGFTNEKTRAVYSIIVATPEGLNSLTPDHILFHRASKILLVKSYFWDQITSIIKQKLASITINEQTAWDDIHYQLSRIFYLERSIFSI